MVLAKFVATIRKLFRVMENLDEDAILIRAIKAGDEDALKHFFDRYAEVIYKQAFLILRDSFESEDVVMEVMMKLWETRDKLEDTGVLRNLVYVLTKRMSLNKLRSRKLMIRESELPYPLEAMDQHKLEDINYCKEIIHLENIVISALSSQQRSVYLLSRREGHSYKEISSMLGISPNTVRNHIVQALKFFKRHFEKVGYPTLLFFLMIH